MTFFKATVGALAGMFLFVAPALAGPTWEFGDENQGKLKLEYRGQFQLVYRDTGAGPDQTGSATEFVLRRDRIALMGAWGEHFSLYFQTEFFDNLAISPTGVNNGTAPVFTVLDAALRFKVVDEFQVWVGKFKYSFTRENLEDCFAPLNLDRSNFIIAPYVSTRDVGAAVWGNLLDGILQYRVDAMTGANDAAVSPKTVLRYSGRAHVSLLEPESYYGYKGTYLGKKKVLTVGGAYQYEAGVAFSDTANSTGTVNYQAWTVDAYFEYPVPDVGTFTASVAYVDYDLGNAYLGASPSLGTSGIDGQKNGGYAKVGYLLPMVPLQIFGRAEQWSFAELKGFYDQRLNWYAGGVNYYFRGQDLKLTAQYSYADFDKVGLVDGVLTSDLNTFVVQLQLIF